MSSPLETDSSTFSELTQLRHQILELQQALVHAKHGHPSTQATALGAAQVGTWEWDSSTNRVIWSPETERIFGLPPEAFDGSYEGFFALVHPDDRQCLSDAIAKAVEDHAPYRVEHRIITPAGATRWVTCRGRAIVHENEPVSGMMGTVEDITARKEFELTQQALRETLETLVRERTAGLEQAVQELKTEIVRRHQAESALKASEQRYQSLYEQNPFMYFTLSPDGTMLSVNNFGADQLGYQKEELIGRSILQLFDSKDHQTVLGQLIACAASPYTVFQWEIPKLRKDGVRIWVKERARAIHAHANQILVLVVCEDATERKRTEKQLQETSRLLQTLVEESAVPIVSLDREARVVSWNEAATRLFGWSREEVLGRELPYIPPEEESASNALWQAGTRRELTGPVELQRRHKDGKILNLLLWPVFVYDEFEQLSLAVGLYVDQSDIKRAEKATLMGQARLRSFLNALDDLAFEFDHNGQCLNVWTHSDDKLLLPKEALIGRPLTTLFGEEAGSSYVETVRRVFATGKAATINYAMRLPQGERHFSGTLTLIPGSEKSGPSVGCIVRDITENRLIEATVRESEIRWRTLYEHADVGIAELSLDGQFLRVNPHLCALLGYSSVALLHRNFQELTHPDDLSSNLAYLEELLTKKRHSFSLEKRYRRSNNTWVWVDLTVSLVHGISGDQDYLIAIIQNIDDRKHSYSLLQAAINSVADGLLIVDRQGKVTSVNQRFRHLWNIPLKLVDSGDDEALLSFVVDQLKEPETFLRKVHELYAHPDRESFDVLNFKDGRVFERYSRPQVLDGEIVGRVWSFRDVTKQTHAEEALRASELRLQRFVADAPVGLCILDDNWRAISANKALCELTGYGEHEILGSTYALYTHPDDLAANMALTDEFFRGIRSEYTYEKRYIRKSGEIIWVSVKATRVELSGHKGPLLLAAVQDITERKLALEEREQLSRDLHDNLLQTLYAVGMQLEASKLAMGQSPRRSKAHISQAISQLNNLMLDVRQFITVLTQHTPRKLDFGQTLQQLTTALAGTEHTAPDLNITPPVLSFITPTTGEQLLNIVREALSNSLRHANASRRWIELRVVDNSICLLIGDNGRGFSTKKRHRKGHGLVNMAARTRQILGSFTLDSSPGRGTTIRVNVPLRKGTVYE